MRRMVNCGVRVQLAFAARLNPFAASREATGAGWLRGVPMSSADCAPLQEHDSAAGRLPVRSCERGLLGCYRQQSSLALKEHGCGA